MEDVPAIEKRSLGEQTYRRLCDRIMEGSVAFGADLNIKEIARDLGVSPMPVREALKRLEADGLVVIKPRSGCALRVPTRESILEALAVRALLETFCVRSIYPSIASEDVARLRELAEAVGRLGKSGEGNRSYVRREFAFREGLCALAANEYVDRTYRGIGLNALLGVLYDPLTAPDLTERYRGHIRLVDALAAHSATAVDLLLSQFDADRERVPGGNSVAPVT